MNYEGFWADFAPSSDPAYGYTFIAITKVNESDYLVIASSTRDPKHLSFFGKGTLNKNNVLIVNTNIGVVWLFSATANADRHESFGVSDRSGETEVAQCRRIRGGDVIPVK